MARTPNAPAAHRPRPGMARRDDPPVTWINVTGRPSAATAPPAPERNANAERAGATDQLSKAAAAAAAMGPPPNGPDRVPPYAAAALTTRSTPPWARAASSTVARTA